MPSPRHASTLTLTLRGKLLLAFLALLLVLRLFTASPSPHAPSAPRLPLAPVVVSLSSTPARLDSTLPPTLWSLVRQSVPPSSIRVHLPLELLSPDGPALLDLDPIYRHPLVDVRYVPDRGPATKFLPALESAFALAREGDLSALSAPLLIVDDDHVYSPALVETLVRAWVEKKGEAVIALRGWRVREDLHWGVGWGDLKRHVVEGWRLKEPYQVGVVTANEGYLLTPSLFLPPALRASLSHPSFSPSALPAPALFSYAPPAPPAAHLVDDIWLSGHLALCAVPRFVVPLRAPEPPSVDITPPAQPEEKGGGRSPVEKHLEEHGQTRAQANDETLRFFAEAWAADRDLSGGEGGGGTLWFDLRAEENRRRDGWPGEPKWAGGVSRAWSQVSKYALWKRARRRWGAVAVWN
ncbi:hypothetical protein JCM10207_008786 [Rhodosporidiobolus poonsookiae]